MSVASSTTPLIGENSCRTPSIFTAVTAAPSIDDSSTRRRALPDGGAEAALERLGREPAEPVGEGVALEVEPLGPLETSPQHGRRPFATGPAARPPDLRIEIAGLPLQV